MPSSVKQLVLNDSLNFVKDNSNKKTSGIVSLTRNTSFSLDTTMLDKIVYVDTSSGDVTVSIPAAQEYLKFTLIKTSPNFKLILNGTVNGQLNPSFIFNDTVILLIADSTNWYFLDVVPRKETEVLASLLSGQTWTINIPSGSNKQFIHQVLARGGIHAETKYIEYSINDEPDFVQEDDSKTHFTIGRVQLERESDIIADHNYEIGNYDFDDRIELQTSGSHKIARLVQGQYFKPIVAMELRALTRPGYFAYTSNILFDMVAKLNGGVDFPLVNMEFDTPANYSYNGSLIEVVGGVARLVDLGGGTYSTAEPSIQLASVETVGAHFNPGDLRFDGPLAASAGFNFINGSPGEPIDSYSDLFLNGWSLTKGGHGDYGETTSWPATLPEMPSPVAYFQVWGLGGETNYARASKTVTPGFFGKTVTFDFDVLFQWSTDNVEEYFQLMLYDGVKLYELRIYKENEPTYKNGIYYRNSASSYIQIVSSAALPPSSQLHNYKFIFDFSTNQLTQIVIDDVNVYGVYVTDWPDLAATDGYMQFGVVGSGLRMYINYIDAYYTGSQVKYTLLLNGSEYIYDDTGGNWIAAAGSKNPGEIFEQGVADLQLFPGDTLGIIVYLWSNGTTQIECDRAKILTNVSYFPGSLETIEHAGAVSINTTTQVKLEAVTADFNMRGDKPSFLYGSPDEFVDWTEDLQDSEVVYNQSKAGKSPVYQLHNLGSVTEPSCYVDLSKILEDKVFDNQLGDEFIGDIWVKIVTYFEFLDGDASYTITIPTSTNRVTLKFSLVGANFKLLCKSGSVEIGNNLVQNETWQEWLFWLQPNLGYIKGVWLDNSFQVGEVDASEAGSYTDAQVKQYLFSTPNNEASVFVDEFRVNRFSPIDVPFIKYALIRDGQQIYWDGGNWVAGALTNFFNDFRTGVNNLTVNQLETFKIKVFIQSDGFHPCNVTRLALSEMTDFPQTKPIIRKVNPSILAEVPTNVHVPEFAEYVDPPPAFPSNLRYGFIHNGVIKRLEGSGVLTETPANISNTATQPHYEMTPGHELWKSASGLYYFQNGNTTFANPRDAKYGKGITIYPQGSIGGTSRPGFTGEQALISVDSVLDDKAALLGDASSYTYSFLMLVKVPVTAQNNTIILSYGSYNTSGQMYVILDQTKIQFYLKYNANIQTVFLNGHTLDLNNWLVVGVVRNTIYSEQVLTLFVDGNVIAEDRETITTAPAWLSSQDFRMFGHTVSAGNPKTHAGECAALECFSTPLTADEVKTRSQEMLNGFKYDLAELNTESQFRARIDDIIPELSVGDNLDIAVQMHSGGVEQTDLARVEVDKSEITYPDDQGYYVHTSAVNRLDVQTWSKISNLVVNSSETGSAYLKFAVSIDGGANWKTYNGVSWISTNLTTIDTNGMTSAEFMAVPETAWYNFLYGSQYMDVAVSLVTTDPSQTPLLFRLDFEGISDYHNRLQDQVDVLIKQYSDRVEIQNITGKTLYDLIFTIIK
jgi:hypothetical protein